MASKTHQEITQYLQLIPEANFEDLESALLEAVLDFHNLSQVKNLEIKKVLKLNNPQRKKAREWIKFNLKTPTIQHILTLYELRVSAENRKLDGAYYTPQKVVDAITDITIGDHIGSVCDPACGSGAFLLGAVRKLQSNGIENIQDIFSKYIWGVDIDHSNILYTKRVLTLFAILNGSDEKEFKIGIFQGNSLVFNWAKTHRGKADFDFLVGNPPYVRGRNLSPELKSQIKSWPTGNIGIADLYIPFFEIGLSWLASKGRLGYITPNTYFSSVNGRGVRKMLSERRIVHKIIDLNGFPAFEGLLTYTCVTILDKAGIQEPLVGVANSLIQLENIRLIKLSPIDYSELAMDDWYIQPKAVALKMRDMETAGIPLEKYVPKFTTGIATLRNDLFIFNTPVINGHISVEVGDKIFFIEEGATVPIIKPNKVKTELQLKQNKERALYPYRFIKNIKRPELIPENELRSTFPGAYSYLKHFKGELEKRSIDSGAKWYAYGRSQALDGFGKKIIFPMMSDRPVFLRVDDPNTLIYCGYALYPESEEQTQILLKILNSKLFWNYLSNTSKNYANGYKSLAKNYVKKFSIPFLTDEEAKLLLSLSDENLVDFLERKYSERFQAPQQELPLLSFVK